MALEKIHSGEVRVLLKTCFVCWNFNQNNFFVVLFIAILLWGIFIANNPPPSMSPIFHSTLNLFLSISICVQKWKNLKKYKQNEKKTEERTFDILLEATLVCLQISFLSCLFCFTSLYMSMVRTKASSSLMLTGIFLHLNLKGLITLHFFCRQKAKS